MNDDMPDGWQDAARTGWDENPAARAYAWARAAYNAYLGASHGRSLVSGEPLPAFDDQATEIQGAWVAAALAARSAE